MYKQTYLSKAMKIMLTNVSDSVYCTTSKRAPLQWRIRSADPTGIMFFHAIDKYVMVIPAHPHCLQVKQKLKIRALASGLC